MTAPKLFISYCWSNSEHEQWVVDFASALCESGVDVILDKWDLKEGQDAIRFMEKMVNDPKINKVIIICDEQYAAKADKRAGGVGTETQIISKEVYENVDQEKFVAVVVKKDENGNAYLPTYYKSRIYIDLSAADTYSDNFTRLLRWIFDKPLYIKPEIGSKPEFLSEGTHVSLGTTALFKRCIDAIRNQKTNAAGSVEEYCTVFAENLERLRLSKPEGEFDDAVVKSIENFLPFRNEAIQLFTAVAQYDNGSQITQTIHRFFEKIISYTSRPQDVSAWKECDFDNYKFIVHELFLYALAVPLKHERIEQANYLLHQPYYLPRNFDLGRDAMASFVVFRQYMHSLEHRNKRLGLGRISLRADLLKERCIGTGISFHYLQQADFVAFMRAEVEAQDDYSGWWPETLLYLDYFNKPFDLFARSISRTYFSRSKALLAIEAPKDLEPLLKSYQNGTRKLPRWEISGFSPAALLGFENLATRP